MTHTNKTPLPWFCLLLWAVVICGCRTPTATNNSVETSRELWYTGQTIGTQTAVPVIDTDSYNVRVQPYDAGSGLLSNAPDGSLAVPLQRGQVAPIAGVLLTGPALAQIEVEHTGLAARCRIDRQTDLDMLAARATRDIQTLLNYINARNQVFELRMGSLIQENTRLSGLLRVSIEGSQRNNSLTSPMFWVTVVGAMFGVTTASLLLFQR